MIEQNMAVRSITIDGEDFVLIPRRQWARVRRKLDPKQSKRALSHASLKGSFTLEDVRFSLARKMSTRRKAAGLTQAQLAKRARVRVETISRLENGLNMPSVPTFDRIDRALTAAENRRAA